MLIRNCVSRSGTDIVFAIKHIAGVTSELLILFSVSKEPASEPRCRERSKLQFILPMFGHPKQCGGLRDGGPPKKLSATTQDLLNTHVVYSSQENVRKRPPQSLLVLLR